MNRNYGKLENGRLVYFDGTLRDGDTYIVAPTAADFRRFGWLPIVDERPTDPAPDGYHYAPTGWNEAEGAIRRVYALVEDPPPHPRVFSKLKVVAALTREGVWPQVKAWIEEAGLYDLYLAAQDFAEDNEYFTSGRAALAAALSWSDEQVEALLSECTAED